MCPAFFIDDAESQLKFGNDPYLNLLDELMNRSRTIKITYYYLAALIILLITSMLDKSHDMEFGSFDGILVSLIVVLPTFFFNLLFYGIPLGILALLITLFINYLIKKDHYIELLDSPADVKVGKFMRSQLIFSRIWFILFVLLLLFRLYETYL